MSITLSLRKPTVQEFNYLRAAAGWPVPEESLVETALTNSSFGVVAKVGNEIIGMARVAGDGAVYFHVLDVIVKPEFQRQGIGKQIMQEVMNYLETVGGKHTNIGLMASKGREDFYKGFGFTERPNAKAGAGMIMVKES